MVALGLVNIALAYLTRNKKKDESEEKQENEAAA
jgi:hypothetical protein